MNLPDRDTASTGERPGMSESLLRTVLIAEGSFVRDLRVYEETESTNADVVELAHSDAPEATIVVAEYQRTGRGRLDRAWSCPSRAGLTFSTLLRPSGVPQHQWGWLPLIAGCAVAGGIRDVAGLRPRLKWPNDVLLEDQKTTGQPSVSPVERKVCGILAHQVETPRGPAAVIGIGVNVSVRADELPVSTATSLAMAGATGAALDRERLLPSIVGHLATLYRQWSTVGAGANTPVPNAVNGPTSASTGTSVAAAYRARCSTLGRDVQVRMGAGERVVGRARDVDADGRLVVTTATGQVACRAGDVVHVR